MLPPFTPGITARRSVTTSATSYTFQGKGRQYMVYSASNLVIGGVGVAGTAAKAASAAGQQWNTPFPPGLVQIFTRNPDNDVALSLKAVTTTGLVYITEGDGQNN